MPSDFSKQLPLPDPVPVKKAGKEHFSGYFSAVATPTAYFKSYFLRK